MLSEPQLRLLREARAQGATVDEPAEYWPVLNEAVRDGGPAQSLALRNGQRTLAALVRDGWIVIEDEGIRLTARAVRHLERIERT